MFRFGSMSRRKRIVTINHGIYEYMYRGYQMDMYMHIHSIFVMSVVFPSWGEESGGSCVSKAAGEEKDKRIESSGSVIFNPINKWDDRPFRLESFKGVLSVLYSICGESLRQKKIPVLVLLSSSSLFGFP